MVTIEVWVLLGVVARVKRVTMVFLKESFGAAVQTFFMVLTKRGKRFGVNYSHLLLLETNISTAAVCIQKYYTNMLFRCIKSDFG